jgi:PAS domain-containing protein
MADKNWQAGGKTSMSARAVFCLIGFTTPFGMARGAPDDFAPPSYVGSADPHVIWELAIGSLVLFSFLAAVTLWVLAALRGAKLSGRNAFVSSALNNLNQGVVITDAQNLVVLCNDRYLEIYGLSRSDIFPGITGRDLLALRRERGTLELSADDYYAQCLTPEGAVTNLPNGCSVLIRCFDLPDGGRLATHEDCSEHRKLSKQLAVTKQFLESVLDNVPVCVAAKNIEDGRYIFANRAFERFSRFSRDQIVGKRADELFQPATAANIEAADRTAINSPDGQFRTELAVERGRHKRVSACQSQRRDHPQPATRGHRRIDGDRYLQSARSQADRRA